jgi:hypothetical protein
MRSVMKNGLLAIGALALAGPAIAPLSAQGDNPRNGGRKITASLTGGAEVPGPGDANGAGLFEARVNPGTERICYTLTASNIDAATAAHIHQGLPTEAGGVVLTLDTPDGDDDDSEDCQDIDRGLAQQIIQNPQNYYVNVHNAPFPNGAIRGQLMK